LDLRADDNGFFITIGLDSEFSDRPQGGVIELDPNKRNMLRIKVQSFYHYSL